MTPLQEVAAFAAASLAGGLDETLRKSAARALLDCLGNSLAASTTPPARAMLALAQESGGHQTASVIGSPQRFPPAMTALVNGTLAHALDFDDTHLPSVLHPSASVIPANLAVAQATHASGSQLLDAIAVGIDITVRLGMAGYDETLGNSVFFERGLHATAICGTVGAAMSVAALRGMDEAGIADAGAIAASMGAGILEANRTGGTVKRIHCGWAAHAAVTAADAARLGITGPPTALEGRFGFLQAFCGNEWTLEPLLSDLGSRWALPGMFFKPYPCNHFTHAGIDAAIALLQDGIDVAAITNIELGLPGPVLRTLAEPAAQKAAPETGYAAAFSGPYTVAAALTGGGGLGLYLADFDDDAVKNPERRRLAALVRCVEDDEANAIFPYQFPARLTVTTNDGQVRTQFVNANRGGPERPLSEDELAMKFALNAAHALQPAAIEAIVQLVGGEADQLDVEALAATWSG